MPAGSLPWVTAGTQDERPLTSVKLSGCCHMWHVCTATAKVQRHAWAYGFLSLRTGGDNLPLPRCNRPRVSARRFGFAEIRRLIDGLLCFGDRCPAKSALIACAHECLSVQYPTAAMTFAETMDKITTTPRVIKLGGSGDLVHQCSNNSRVVVIFSIFSAKVSLPLGTVRAKAFVGTRDES